MSAALAPRSGAPWLAIVGIGEDGVEGLTGRGARAARKRRSSWSAGARHLALADR